MMGTVASIKHYSMKDLFLGILRTNFIRTLSIFAKEAM